MARVGAAGLALGDDLGPHRRRDLLGAQLHAGLPSFRSSSRATSRSSKGTLRPPSNSWPCSWPLPAMTTVSPGSARPSARAIAARRSTSTSTSAPPAGPGDDFGDDRLRVLGARVVGGDDGEVGELRPGPPHLRPLVAVAVAAGAEDRDHPPRGQPPRRPQHVLQRVRRVRVVDQDREPLPLVDRLEPPRHPRRLRQPRRRRLPLDPHRLRHRERPQRIRHIEMPRQPRPHPTSPPTGRFRQPDVRPVGRRHGELAPRRRR